MQINERELTDENKRLLEENQRLKSALEQKKVYETLFHASPDIIIQVDSNFKVIELNLPNRPVTRSEELRGSDLFDITPPTLHSKMKTALEKVFSKGETVRYESEGEILGKYSYFLNYLTPLKDEQGITYSAYFVSKRGTTKRYTH
jgi:PAS domain S-box-containing protein